MDNSKRYQVEFSGKAYPTEYRPIMMRIRAATPERAKEWAERQLAAWNLDPKDKGIKVLVTQIEEEAATEQAERKAEKKAKKAKKVDPVAASTAGEKKPEAK